MCGVICTISFNKEFDSVKRVLRQYEKQKFRGREGFGFVAVDKKGITWGRFQEETDAKEALSKLEDVKILMFHHRYPTSSPNTAKTNHPICIQDKKLLKNKYFLIHNGIISNHRDMWKAHEDLGYKYSSEVEVRYGGRNPFYLESNDSEAIGTEIALFIEGKKEEVEARGSMAIILLEVNKSNRPTNLYFYQNGRNPLIYNRNQLGMLIASEAKGEKVRSDTLYRFNLKTKKLHKKRVDTDGFERTRWDKKEERWSLVFGESTKARRLLNNNNMGFDTFVDKQYPPQSSEIQLLNRRWMDLTAEHEENKEELDKYKDMITDDFDYAPEKQALKERNGFLFKQITLVEEKILEAEGFIYNERIR